MATPRNMTEIVLLDRGFSKVNEKVFKKIFLPVMNEGEDGSEHCCIDIDEGEADDDGVKNVFVSYLKKLCTSYFGKSPSYIALADNLEEKQEPLFLRVDSLPRFIREKIFDCKKFDIENWESLNEGMKSAARLKSVGVAPEWRTARETLEFLDILRTIRNACMTRAQLFEVLRL